MNNKTISVKGSNTFEDDEIFEDSTFLACFENSSFGDISNRLNTANVSALNVSALCCDEEISGYDKLTGGTWIYPTNYPVRDYQFNIIKSSILKNTLVSLPTGLGKTFIAAVIMYNFYRWYPIGKIVFTAPTRPLVAQQIDACYNIIAIPPDDTIEMTGNMPVNTRKAHWQKKRVFFATPQVIYNDIKSGICPGEKIRCLVVDEAHRARGNYAYCQIVSTLTDMGHKTYRVLALSATPGSKVEDVATVVRNLHIAHLELRTENCIDVAPYSHTRKINTVIVKLGAELTNLRQQFVEILDGYARRLKQLNILPYNLGNLSKGRIVMLYKEFQTKERSQSIWNPQYTIYIHRLEQIQRKFVNYLKFEEYRDESTYAKDLAHYRLGSLGLRRRQADMLLLHDVLNGARDCPQLLHAIQLCAPSNRTRHTALLHPQHNMIMKDFTLLISLYHGLELLTKHGSRVFLNFFDDHPEKSWIQSDDNLTALLERLRDDLGMNPLALNRSILPDGTIPEIPSNLCFGHPKFNKLKEIMLEHFETSKQKGQDTRAIVFCEYRESVNLVHCLLLQCRPLINPQMFVGQGASGKDGKTVVSQKQQLRVMRNFREGVCNALVATCVAEEGLDVGSVDLILCFDISTRSPIRLVQRCGRTGRERGGNVFILVTEGKEHQTLTECIRQRDGLNRKILHSKEVEHSLYQANPRMMPNDFTPECQKMYITVAKKVDPKENKKESLQKSKKEVPGSNPGTDGYLCDVYSSQVRDGQNDLRSMLLGRASTSGLGQSSTNTTSSCATGELITEQEFKEIYPNGFKTKDYFDKSVDYWCMNKDTFKEHCRTVEKPRLSTWLEWQRTLQKTVNFEHSKDTEILTKLLQYSDAKRFEMPASTQNPTFNTQDFATQHILMQASSPAKPKQASSPAKPKQVKKKSKAPVLKSPHKKDGDIRALFSTATKSTKNYTKLINELGIPSDGSIPTKLINLLVDLSIDNNDTKKCYVCSCICECLLLQSIKKNDEKPNTFIRFLAEPKFPDIDLIDELDAESILKCAKQQSFDITIQNIPQDNNITINDHNCTNNFDLELDFISDFNNDPSPALQNIETKPSSQDKNFDIGEIENLFADSSPEEVEQTKKSEPTLENQTDKPEEVFKFFQLDSIEDIFADDSYEPAENNPKTPELKTEKCEAPKSITPVKEVNNDIEKELLSPSILSGKLNDNTSITTSPILCSQGRKFSLSIKKKRNHSTSNTSAAIKSLQFAQTLNNNKLDCSLKPNNANQSVADKSDKSMFTVTQIINMINKTDNQISSTELNKPASKVPEVVVHNDNEDDRSSSPILFTQADRKHNSNNLNASCSSKIFNTEPKKYESLIILDSDSDFDDTEVYDIKDKGNLNIKFASKEAINTPTTKRKYDLNESDPMTASPYFKKRQKVDNSCKKPLTLQEKVLAAITTNNLNKSTNSQHQINFVMTSPILPSQKENRSPEFLNEELAELEDFDIKDSKKRNNLAILQMFTRNSKVKSPKKVFEAIANSPVKTSQKRKLIFNDSDDDFAESFKNNEKNQRSTNHDRQEKLVHHKARKNKKRKANSFIDDEAALSDSRSVSGDELSDESVGSIIDFICDGDDGETHSEEDIQALYLQSVKSPINGKFKIPNLPKKINNLDVFSQYVEEDSYEMDSFCVDSHIGLTQVNEISELELAEIVLEKNKKTCKRKPQIREVMENEESPVVRRKTKKLRRLIQSDSEESS